MKPATNYARFLGVWCLCAPFGVAAQPPTITFESIATSATAKQVAKLKIRLDTVSRRVVLPVCPGTNLRHFKPSFATPAGVTVTPGSGDFSKGPCLTRLP